MRILHFLKEQQAFEAEAIGHGFGREDRAGRLLRGLYHPELDLAVEVEMLDQAVKLFQLAEHLDEAYLAARIRDETGGVVDLAYLKEMANDQNNACR